MMPCVLHSQLRPLLRLPQAHRAASSPLLDSTPSQGGRPGEVTLHQKQVAAATGLRKEGKGRAQPRKTTQHSVAFTPLTSLCWPLFLPWKAWVFMMLFVQIPPWACPLPKTPCPHKHTHTRTVSSNDIPIAHCHFVGSLGKSCPPGQMKNVGGWEEIGPNS